jgi:predicted molibdopterin-dependent oxidoreductase YjgC
VFLVDHRACVLCDRCARACDDVKNNHVIGRTGKGAAAGIGFDLNDRMGESGCVQCGECMVSCPTSAITFRPLRRAGEATAAEAGPAAAAGDPGAGGVARDGGVVL